MKQEVTRRNWFGCIPASLLGAGVLLLALSGGAPPARAQAFSTQFTGAPTWQKGSPFTVSWNYSGAPPALVTQYGVKVVAVSMAGSNTTYILTPQSVSFSSKQATIPALNFSYTQDTPIQIVLEDTNGNKLTPVFNVTIKMPPTYNFTLQITSVDPLVANGNAGYVHFNYSGTPPPALMQCGVDVVFATPQRSYQLTRQTPVTAKQAPLGGIGFAANTTGNLTLADSCSGQQLTPASPVIVRAAGTAPVPAPAPAPAPAPVTGNASYAAAACTYVFGSQGCTGNSAQFANYLIQPSGNAPMFPSQAAMQAYLINYVGTNPGVKSDIINRASGVQPCTEAITALTAAFTGNAGNPQGNGLWNSYAQLASMAPALVKSKCTVTAPPTLTWTPQQHDQAVNLAIGKLMGFTMPNGQAVTLTPQQAALFANVAPANIEGSMGSAIRNDPNWQGLIVDYMYYAAFKKAETAAQRSQFLGFYGKYWSAGDDLYPYLAANGAYYNPAITWTQQQHDQAMVAAVSKLMGNSTPTGQAVTLTPQQVALFTNVAPANIETQMRSNIASDKSWQDRIVGYMYYAAFKKTETAAVHSQIIAQYRVHWTAGDDLYQFLTAPANVAIFNPPTPVDATLVNAEFRTLTGNFTAATPSDLKVTDPTKVGVDTAVRVYIQTHTALLDPIVQYAYSQIFATDSASSRATLKGLYLKSWTAADDLYKYVWDNRTKYAPPTPPTPAPPVKVAERVEQCFGAVGKGCEGSGASWYDGTSSLFPMVRLGCSGAVNGYRNCWVAPGSIKHDNCCHVNTNGKECGGNDSSNACAEEWEEACNDVVHGRAWSQAVPDGPSDLRPVPSTRLPSGERFSTSVLCAPGGTNISSYHTAAYCCSNSFKSNWYNPFLPTDNPTRNWGVCADVGSRSVLSVGGPQQWTAALPVAPGAPPPPPTAADIQKARNGGK